MKTASAFTPEEANTLISNLTYEQKMLLRDFLLAIKYEEKDAS